MAGKVERNKKKKKTIRKGRIKLAAGWRVKTCYLLFANDSNWISKKVNPIGVKEKEEEEEKKEEVWNG